MSRAEAKPLVVVKTEFAPSASFLKKRIAADLGTQITPEQFVAEQFITSAAVLKMFDFSQQGTSEYVLTIRVDSDPRRPWPRGDVDIKFLIAGREFGPMPFCKRAACNGECIPDSFATAKWYTKKFDELLEYWPPGFLKHIPLTKQATYSKGRIIVPTRIADFGQEKGGPPTAYFALEMAGTQRHFVFCDEQPQGRAVGDDHGSTPSANCAKGPTSAGMLPGLGVITVLKGVVK